MTRAGQGTTPLTGGLPPARRRAPASQAKDVERGLRLDLPIVRYTNDAETEQFLEREARKLAPGMKRRSGARYRLNRWREAQIRDGRKLRYRDLVREYVRLNESPEPFAQAPHGRYINFLSDSLASRGGATHEQARKAWAAVKKMDAPKTYAAWPGRGAGTMSLNRKGVSPMTVSEVLALLDAERDERGMSSRGVTVVISRRLPREPGHPRHDLR